MRPPKIVPSGLVSRGIITTRIAGCSSLGSLMPRSCSEESSIETQKHHSKIHSLPSFTPSSISATAPYAFAPNLANLLLTPLLQQGVHVLPRHDNRFSGLPANAQSAGI